jgi:hypothetical protein
MSYQKPEKEFGEGPVRFAMRQEFSNLKRIY